MPRNVFRYIPGAHGFDALLVGVYENKQLIFVAKVKNGFVPRLRDEIFPTLKTLRAAHCPFANLPEKRASRWGESLTAEKMKQCRWVKPKLICQVALLKAIPQCADLLILADPQRVR
jgi:ATP dependent DNA ligase C terminal region